MTGTAAWYRASRSRRLLTQRVTIVVFADASPASTRKHIVSVNEGHPLHFFSTYWTRGVNFKPLRAALVMKRVRALEDENQFLVFKAFGADRALGDGVVFNMAYRAVDDLNLDVPVCAEKLKPARAADDAARETAERRTRRGAYASLVELFKRRCAANETIG
jgi:hypothetical protein